MEDTKAADALLQKAKEYLEKAKELFEEMDLQNTPFYYSESVDIIGKRK
jgi:hypothetical protein